MTTNKKNIILLTSCLIVATSFLYGILSISKLFPFEAVLFITISTLIFGIILILLVFQQPKKDTIRIGIDIHGMIDYDPSFFAELSKTLVESGHEVHIMTGSEIQPAIIAELRGYGVMWTHLFSISDYYKNKPGVKLWRDERGRPWVNEELWNQSKGLYAQEQKLDLVLDDTPVYGNYFVTSFGYCKIINKSGKQRGPKAVMPEPPTTTNNYIIPIVPPSDREKLNEGVDKK